MELEDYGLSRERGYLSHYEIDEISLPEQFAPIVEAAGNLSALLTTGRVRHFLDALPDPQIGEWAENASEEEVRTAMVHYSFLVQAYVWGEDDPPAHLPANLSRPMCALADRLGSPTSVRSRSLCHSSVRVVASTKLWRRITAWTIVHVRKGEKGGDLPVGA